MGCKFLYILYMLIFFNKKKNASIREYLLIQARRNTQVSITWTASNYPVGSRIDLTLSPKGTTGQEIFLAASQLTSPYKYSIEAYMRAGEYEIKAYEAGTYALLGTSNTIYMGPPRCSNHGDCSGSEYCDLDSQCYPCSECLFARDAIDHICPTKCGGIGEAVVGDRFPDLPEVRKSRAPLFFAYEYTKNLPPPPKKKDPKCHW